MSTCMTSTATTSRINSPVVTTVSNSSANAGGGAKTAPVASGFGAASASSFGTGATGSIFGGGKAAAFGAPPLLAELPRVFFSAACIGSRAPLA
ncbi:MAG: hypothetical protein ACK559_37280, partial [bacterium]